MSLITGARAPYSLRPVAFPFPALAAAGGRAPLGGPRETALACLLVVRMVVDAVNAPSVSADGRKTRVQHARHWLGAAALTPPVRAALVRLAESTVEQNGAMNSALDSVMTVTANQLDPAARLELSKLAQALAG